VFTINLNELQFFSHHGVHDEERVLGNNFIVHVSLQIDGEEKISSIDQTVNYVSVFNIIKKRMASPTALLETVAEEIAAAIRDLDQRIKSIQVSIEKKAPPIAGMQGSVSVSYSKKY
jgi:7,8-dihydroneopterin aldolase/epimerase/oxygenase